MKLSDYDDETVRKNRENECTRVVLKCKSFLISIINDFDFDVSDISTEKVYKKVKFTAKNGGLIKTNNNKIHDYTMWKIKCRELDIITRLWSCFSIVGEKCFNMDDEKIKSDFIKKMEKSSQLELGFKLTKEIEDKEDVFVDFFTHFGFRDIFKLTVSKNEKGQISGLLEFNTVPDFKFPEKKAIETHTYILNNKLSKNYVNEKTIKIHINRNVDIDEDEYPTSFTFVEDLPDELYEIFKKNVPEFLKASGCKQIIIKKDF